MNMNPHWLGAHPTYTLSKYGMTLLSLGWAAEYSDADIGFSCLWPETYIATSAVTNLAEGDKLAARSRNPQIMADAAVEILTRPPAAVNGQCYIDSQVLTEAGDDRPVPLRGWRRPDTGYLRRQIMSISLLLEMASSSDPDRTAWSPATCG